jgi:hypothetical protein
MRLTAPKGAGGMPRRHQNSGVEGCDKPGGAAKRASIPGYPSNPGRSKVKLKPQVPRIIPGDWGKVRSGWLTRLLKTGAQVSARQNSPVPLAVFAHRQMRMRNLAASSDEKPLRVESSSLGTFRSRMNRSHPEGEQLLLCISTDG